jgi:kynureninase
MSAVIGNDEIAELDAADPLRLFRDEFQLRDGLIYVDGNSLGAAPLATRKSVAYTIAKAWGEGLITSWLDAQWSTAPQRVGDKIASIIGAQSGEVIATDSTSVNIFKALTAAISLQADRTVILSERTNFPTDVYMMQGIEAFSGGRLKSETVDPDAVIERLDSDVAVLLLTQVHYKSGLVRDMAEVTRCAHAKGVLVVWDLSHSAGSIEVDLNGAGADFAVGCGYKYLNGGPGAPAFLFVAKRHQAAASVLSGWFGHANPFSFEEDYRPADGITRFLCGTPPVLGLTALECGVDLMRRADMREIRKKSLRLGVLFTERMEQRCAEFGFKLVSPRDPQLRGSQISYAHPNGYEIVQALKARDVIGDFRAPNILRFGLTPLYLRYADVVEAVERLRDICLNRAWDKAEYRERAAVT